MTDNDKSLINLQFMKFAMKELRKYFAESDLEKIDPQTLLSSISKGVRSFNSRYMSPKS